MTTMVRIPAGKASDLAPGECRKIVHEPPIALYHVAGAFYATDDWCTHDKASLSEGWLNDDCTIDCPWHLAKFDVRTGEALSAPASTALRTYPVEQEGDELYVVVA